MRGIAVVWTRNKATITYLCFAGVANVVIAVLHTTGAIR